MSELLSEAEGQFRAQGMGTPGAAGGTYGSVPGASLSVSDALDADLDAYLDRELFVGSKARPESRKPEAEPVSESSGSMRALLDMAEEESEWLGTLPAPVPSMAEPAPEPEEPEVEIPEWMRVAPGAKEPLPFAAMLAPVAQGPVEAHPEAARTDAAGLPATPWSVPVSTPVHQGNLLPGIAPPPPPSMAVQGAMLPPWAPQHAVPMGHVPQPHWGMPMAAAPAPTRIAGMRPGAFLGAAAVGALAAGLLVVAGLHVREHVMVAPDVATVSMRAVGQEPPDTGPADGQTSGAQSQVGAPGTMPSSGGTGTTHPHASGQMRMQGDTSGTLPYLGPAGAAQTHASSQFGAQGGTFGTSLFPEWTGTSWASSLPGPLGTQVASSSATSPGAVTVSQEGVAGARSLTGTPGPSGVQQAGASVASTVLSTERADVQGAANSLRASLPETAPVNGPAAEDTTHTRGKPAMVAIREPSSRKALAKTASTEPARTATSTNDEADTSTSEPSSDEAGSGDGADEESIASFEGSDTESGKKVAVSSTDARPPNPYSELDEDFARELGFTEDAEKKVAADPKASRTVYIPPAPDAKQHLTPDDVKAVVVTNQPAITACLRQHAKGTPVEGGGRFMVRWSVLPSGDTSSVAMDTDALRATPLARCIEDVVRRWKFPAHQVRMQEPIRFPFVF